MKILSATFHVVSEYSMTLNDIDPVESAEAVGLPNRSRATGTAWRSWGREETLASGALVNRSSLFVYIYTEFLPNSLKQNFQSIWKQKLVHTSFSYAFFSLLTDKGKGPQNSWVFSSQKIPDRSNCVG